MNALDKHYTALLEENGYKEFVTKGSGFSRTIVEAMERHAKDYHENKVKKFNKPAVMQRSEQLVCDKCVDGLNKSKSFEKDTCVHCRKKV